MFGSNLIKNLFAGQSRDSDAVLSALSDSQAIIEFKLDGTILTANENFCQAMGYSLNQIKGQHHRMFVDSEYGNGAEYKEFWRNLAAGNFDSGEYKRIANGGREIWIQASYNPVVDAKGRPYKVVKIAADITEKTIAAADSNGQIEAIDRSQAVIEFELDGTIVNANQNFLNAVGYSLSEIKGRHHSIFVGNEYGASAEYRDFWAKLGRGEFDAGEYQRFGKGGKSIWIQASYNPIFDKAGRPIKVVKYASDITERKEVFAQVADVLKAYSEGDMSSSVDVPKGSEFQELADNINSFRDVISELIGSIKDSTNTVTNGAESIASGNANLSSRTEQQAASLEQTASSMDEISTTVQQTASNAGEANDLVKSAETKAVRGGDVIRETVEAMNEIKDSSGRISEIISVIDEIAFQTNLLALNASVEAARAGEQGRGFAVVASEVRNLAGRSATAAKEIKDLIEDSVKKVDFGSTLVNRSGDTLTDIVNGVKDVAKIVGEISVAAGEQSQGVAEAHKAIAQLQMLTQQNTAMVEEAAAASEELGDQARALNDSMAFFKSVGSSGCSAPVQVERRSKDRPWSGNNSSSTSSEESQTLAAVGGDWSEF